MSTDDRLLRLENSFNTLVELARGQEERMDTHLSWLNQLGEADARLREAQANSERKIEALTDAMIHMEEALIRVEETLIRVGETLIRVGEAQARSDDKIAALADSQIRTDEVLRRLAEAQIKTDRRVDALSGRGGEAHDGP